jgi:DHA2 family multidrug resistance protein
LIALLFGFLLNFMVFGYAGLIPPILQNHMGYPVLTTGWVMMPRGIGTMVSSLLAGALLLRYPPKPVVAAGVVMIAGSTWLFSQFTPDVDAVTVMVAVFIQGAGFGFLSVALMTVAFHSLSPALRSDGTSVLSLARRLGSSIGVSVLVGQLVRSTQSARSMLTENISQYNERLRHLPLPERWNMEEVQGVMSLDRMIEKQAEFIAYLHDFRLMTVLMLALLPLVLLIRSREDEPAE